MRSRQGRSRQDHRPRHASVHVIRGSILGGGVRRGGSAACKAKGPGPCVRRGSVRPPTDRSAGARNVRAAR
eukprot:1110785-Prymnesium_polylepis.1